MPFDLDSRVVLTSRYLTVWLRVLFLAWERMVIKKNLAAYVSEAESLKQRLGSSKESIWKMKKADLVEVAQRECGLSLAKAQADTVEILREKIRTVRKFRDSLDDPLAATPKGMGKMSLEELRDEVQKRGLPVDPNGTRVQLQMMIRDDADHRIMQSAPGATATGTVDEDFEMVPATRAKAKPTPKTQNRM